ncbi:WXG100 family type VII secretion target [Aspergillus mulundensis]|uniref:Uncharacterized protein n=1 Tax=Aspergillus mulundensis TaxID=1810919 RepID=A0A3D8QRT8_9EURO|nr:hypothetical protein DSM5745_09923 [Aspergillus mulundensis]RDW64512.1 hypothetical protein DSM5745_09923 [Aspergillus mulundensis]
MQLTKALSASLLAALAASAPVPSPQIQVDYAQLQALANSVQSFAQSTSSQFGSLSSDFNAVAGSFSGSAQQSLSQLFTSLSDSVSRIQQTSNSVVDALNNAAQTYEQAESENAGVWSKFQARGDAHDLGSEYLSGVDTPADSSTDDSAWTKLRTRGRLGYNEAPVDDEFAAIKMVASDGKDATTSALAEDIAVATPKGEASLSSDGSDAGAYTQGAGGASGSVSVPVSADATQSGAEAGVGGVKGYNEPTSRSVGGGKGNDYATDNIHATEAAVGGGKGNDVGV